SKVRGRGRGACAAAAHPPGHGLEVDRLGVRPAGPRDSRRLPVPVGHRVLSRGQATAAGLMTEFLRFPHTPHLAWLGTAPLRGDKVLSPVEVEALLSRTVVVEEKVDGANLGFSVDESGALR